MEVCYFHVPRDEAPFGIDGCCLSGHYERKLKHLENQKEAKRKMKRIGRVDLPQEAFFDILSTKRR
jgi:translation elongation factor EF-4